MKSIIKYFSFFIVFANFSFGYAEEIRVLFIGNSITYYYNMPQMLEAISKANPNNRQIKTTLNATGGRTLTRASNDPNVLNLIREGNFDYVVLQPHSKLNNRRMVNGQPRIFDENSLMESLKVFVDVIGETEAQPVLFKHWFSKNVPQEDKPFFNWAFGLASKTYDIPVLDMDSLWNNFRADNPTLPLFEDTVHPNSRGALLSATGWYKFFAKPQGEFDIPKKITGTSITKRSGRVNQNQTVTLVEINETDIPKIHKAHKAIGFPVMATYISVRPPKPSFANN